MERRLAATARSTVGAANATVFAPSGVTMTVHKRSYSLDPRAAEYLDRRAKKLKRSASSVLSELVVEPAQNEARDRALEELGEGVDISERDVHRWLKRLGAA
jgi:hypothetical protein